MLHLVIGTGEVGRAVREVLASGPDEVRSRDFWPDSLDPLDVDMVHICFPWSLGFITYVEEYVERYAPSVIVIHSTVPVGTSRLLGACHSPVRGRHPQLALSIRTFVKFFAGTEAEEAAKAFADCGVPTEIVAEPETTEAGKLWDLLQYGLSIIVQKQMFDWCARKLADPAVAYTRFNETYNTGYREIGLPEFTRPVLENQAGPIGGHCIIQSAPFIDHELAEILIRLNSLHEGVAAHADDA